MEDNRIGAAGVILFTVSLNSFRGSSDKCAAMY